MTLKDSLIVLFIVGAMSLVANVIGTPYGVIESIPGLLILFAMAFTGMAMAKFLPGNIPAVAYVVTLACLHSYPGVPGSEYVNAYVKKVGFLLCNHAMSLTSVESELNILRTDNELPTPMRCIAPMEVVSGWQQDTL